MSTGALQSSSNFIAGYQQENLMRPFKMCVNVVCKKNYQPFHHFLRSISKSQRCVSLQSSVPDVSGKALEPGDDTAAS